MFLYSSIVSRERMAEILPNVMGTLSALHLRKKLIIYSSSILLRENLLKQYGTHFLVWTPMEVKWAYCLPMICDYKGRPSHTRPEGDF